MSRDDAAWKAIREWNAAVHAYWGRLEGYRQRLLAHTLGQVTCSDDEHAHDVENLPCEGCGAAL